MGEREISRQETVSACDAGAPNWVVEIVKIALDVEKSEDLRKEESNAWEKHSIYKLPEGFVWNKERRFHAYKPQLVSLGPYHHGEEQVVAMEEHKLRALRQFLARIIRKYQEVLKQEEGPQQLKDSYKDLDKVVGEYWEALKQGEELQQLMDSYKDLDKWREDKERFLNIMILDGCFMLEVMRLMDRSTFDEYDKNDPIFSRNGFISYLPWIQRDMLMLENQIPLLVLHKLLAVERGLIHEQDKEKQWELHQDVNNMVLDFFQQEKMETPPSLKTRFMRCMHRIFVRFRSTNTPPETTPLPQTIRNTKKQSNSVPVTQTNNANPPAAATTSSDDHEVWGLHVLDVVRKSMIKDIKRRIRRSRCDQKGTYDVIWPATQLEEAGIRFRKSDSTSLKDIDFQIGFLHATLSLPQLLVDDATESKFLNLMAFEHRHKGSEKEVSSYVSFMHTIIKSDKDASLLSENNIIKNFVGTDQAVADLFNGISHDVYIDPFTNLGRVCLEVLDYCNDPVNKYRANKYLVDLKRSYFKSPWTFISLMAAILLLSLTIIQSVYTMLQYYKPN